jgi:hypothetical protein
MLSVLAKETDIISREINIGSCLEVNTCRKLERVDSRDTIFTFVLRHDTFRWVSTRHCHCICCDLFLTLKRDKGKHKTRTPASDPTMQQDWQHCLGPAHNHKSLRSSDRLDHRWDCTALWHFLKRPMLTPTQRPTFSEKRFWRLSHDDIEIRFAIKYMSLGLHNYGRQSQSRIAIISGMEEVSECIGRGWQTTA